MLYGKLNPSTADSTLHLLNEPPNHITSDLSIKKVLLNHTSTNKKETMSYQEALIRATRPQKFKNNTTRLNKLFPSVFIADEN